MKTSRGEEGEKANIKSNDHSWTSKYSYMCFHLSRRTVKPVHSFLLITASDFWIKEVRFMCIRKKEKKNQHLHACVTDLSNKTWKYDVDH